MHLQQQRLDGVQTYDAVNAALTVLPRNAGNHAAELPDDVPPLAIKLQTDAVDSPKGPRVPAEWNMFGTHASSFVNYGDYQTAITAAHGLEPAGDGRSAHRRRRDDSG